MLATLLLEIVDSRLLSVVTWYHLSFVAISVAMLGAAAGAVAVFVVARPVPAERSARGSRRLGRPLRAGPAGLAPAVAGHPDARRPAVGGDGRRGAGAGPGVIATPFALGGVVTTLALTRTHAPVGRLYAADLLGAAAGCLAAVLLLDHANLSTAAFAATAVAATGALCFRRAAGLSASDSSCRSRSSLALAAAGLNVGGEAVRVMYPKNRHAWNKPVLRSLWNSHAHILAFLPEVGPAFYWGGGDGAEQFTNTQAFVVVDGEAGTPMTEWDGDPASLDWVSYDVTALPYYLRRGGRVARGRRRRRPRHPGGDLERQPVDHRRRDQQQRRGAARPSTTAASRGSPITPACSSCTTRAAPILTRSPEQFDVLQMSLVDTWAATGAGAFTLSENGLYTREAWQIFLDRLTPTGVLSVSRWFSQAQASETSRLIALAVQRAARPRGAAIRWQHLALVARAATSPRCWCRRRRSSAADLDALDAASAARGFTVLASSRVPAADARLDAIVAQPLERRARRPRPPTRCSTTRRPPTRGRSSSTWCGRVVVARRHRLRWRRHRRQPARHRHAGGDLRACRWRLSSPRIVVPLVAARPSGAAGRVAWPPALAYFARHRHRVHAARRWRSCSASRCCSAIPPTRWWSCCSR